MRGGGVARQMCCVFFFCIVPKKTAVLLPAGCPCNVGVIPGNQKSKSSLFSGAGGVVTNDWCIMILFKKQKSILTLKAPRKNESEK